MLQRRSTLGFLAVVASMSLHAQEPSFKSARQNGAPFAHLSIGGGLLFNPKSGQVGPDGTSSSLLKTVSLAGTYVAPSGWGGCVDYDHSRSTAERMPPDYSCFALLGPCEPTDDLSTFSFRVVKEVRPVKDPMRVGLEAGPLIARLKQTLFSPKPAGSNVAANYVTNEETRTAWGFSMRAKTLVPFGRVVGFEVGLFANLSSFQSLFGIDMALVVGVLRARRGS